MSFSSLAIDRQDELLSHLPETLQRQLSVSLNRKLFINVRLFHQCDGAIILALAERLRPQLALVSDGLGARLEVPEQGFRLGRISTDVAQNLTRRKPRRASRKSHLSTRVEA